jgi:pimeloyl-ACP methyl ester carboxylesterase
MSARLLVAMLLLPAALSAQRATVQARAYAIRASSGDTILVERWLARGGSIRSEQRPRAGPPSTWRLDEDPEAMLERLTTDDPIEVVSVPGLTLTRVSAAGTPGPRSVTPPGTALLAPASLAILQRQLLRADVQGDIWYNGHWFTPTVRLVRESLVLDTLRVWTIGVDSLRIASAEWQLRLALDEDNVILGGHGLLDGRPVTIARLPDQRAATGWLPTPVASEQSTDARWEVRPFTVAVSGGVTLGGTLTRPTTSGPHQAMLLLSGSGAQDRDGGIMLGQRPLREIAIALAEHGIASLRLDDRGVGASGGDYASRTIAELADDASRALRALAATSGIDAEALGIIGHSEGALVAMQAVANGTDAKALVLLGSPSRTGREIVAAQQRYGAAQMVRDSAAERQPALIASLVAGSAEAIEQLRRESRGFRALLDHDPMRTARRVRVPTLILHGEADAQVPVAQADELAAALRRGGAEVTVERLPEVNHLFLADPHGDPTRYLLLASRQLVPTVLAAITRWLEARLP